MIRATMLSLVVSGWMPVHAQPGDLTCATQKAEVDKLEEWVSYDRSAKTPNLTTNLAKLSAANASLTNCRNASDHDTIGPRNTSVHRVGEIAAQTVDVYTHMSKDPIAGTYKVRFTNTTGTTLSGMAELFVFHDFSETHASLTTDLGTVERNQQKEIVWDVPASMLVQELQALRSATNESPHTYYHQRVPNRFLIFLRTPKGVFEVTYSSAASGLGSATSGYNEYTPDPDGMYPVREETVGITSGEVRSYILKHGHGVSLP